ILAMMREPNAVLWWVVGGAAAFLTLVLSMPFLRKLFHFGSMHLADLALCVAVGVASILWFELVKLMRSHVTRINIVSRSS
ncbi:MAG: cation transporting ATPase C-terminal domain-containing protein, partial [Candidatus Methylomirabilales bacterium]